MTEIPISVSRETLFHASAASSRASSERLFSMPVEVAKAPYHHPACLESLEADTQAHQVLSLSG